MNTVSDNKLANQSGAALVTSLMLLTVLTLLSVSVMSTSRLQMTMSGNTQVSQNAFQLAQTAADRFIARALNNANCPNDVNPGFCNIEVEKKTSMYGTMELTNTFTEFVEGYCPVDSGGTSIGKFNTFYFEAVAEGKTTEGRGGHAIQTQGWYVCRNSGK